MSAQGSLAPTLPGRQWSRVKEIFHGALPLPDEEQGRFLDRACGQDEELRAQVWALLEQDRRPQPLLDGATAESLAKILRLELSEGLPQELVGERLGPYRVLHAIGKGGESTVYLGERDDGQFQQRVAIKVLEGAPAAGSSAGGMERQILARLNHPAIARLYDAGTTEEGRPYVVMEWIDGRPIDLYCEERRLSVPRRLELFLEVCGAVKHAHQSLVVHGDLKPGNILVTAEDRPKLLDFGISRLLEGAIFQAGDPGARALTPAYASPEQQRGEALTAASDVYSLGVILYRLLAGGRAAPATRGLHGDLDAIVLKALAPDPAERYPSVAELAADLRRHRQRRPVTARGGSWLYRGRRWLRRRWWVAAGLVLGLAGLAAMGLQERRLHRALQAAQQEEARAAAVTEFLDRLLAASSPNAAPGEELTVRGVLDQASRALSVELAPQPKVQAQLLETLGRTYQTLGHLERAEEALSAAVGLRRALATDGPSREALATGLDRLAALRLQQGSFDEAESLGAEVLAIRRQLHGPRHLAVAEGLNNLGEVYRERGELDRAEELLVEAARMRKTLVGTEHRAHLESLFELGILYQDQGKGEKAAATFERALPLARRLLGEEHTETLQLTHDLAFLLRDTERRELAESLYRRAVEGYGKVLGEEHPWTATATRNLARLLRDQRRFGEARELLARVLAVQLGRSPEGDVTTAYAEEDVGRLHLKAGEPAAAEPHLRRALFLLRRDLPPEDWRIASTRSVLGECLTALGRFEEAERHLLEALPVLERQFGLEGARTAKTGQRLTALRKAKG